MILAAEGLTKTFEGVAAVTDVSFEIAERDITALIGPNGAGKTTIFNMVNGMLKPTAGTILFKGEPLNGLKPHQRAALGLGRTFQIIRPFAEMTVLENVMVGYHLRMKTGLFSSAFRLPVTRRDESNARKKAMEELDFMGLTARALQPSGSLPMGDQRMMEIARALVFDPDLVLFDEPAAGLNNTETNRLVETLFKIKERGITILLVEHDMSMVMRVSDRIIVINRGQKLTEGTPEEVRNNCLVIEAYLGKETC
jgi:branched-chain amino acid transport system ATP-binding protein